MHNRFRKMCALAATGQLEVRYRQALEEHLASCASCSEFAQDLVHLRSNAIPSVAARRAEADAVEPPSGIRERFLERIGAAPSIAHEPQVATPPAIVQTSFAAKSTQWPLLLAAAASLTFTIFVFLTAREWHSRPRANEVRTTSQQHAIASFLAVSQKLAAAKAQENELAEKLEAITTSFDRSQSRLDKQTREKAQALKDAEVLIAKLKDADDRAARLKLDFEAAQQKLAENDARVVAQQQAEQLAVARLADTERELEHQREALSARNDAAELISARNLHIVDVRESGPDGEQRAFGRVFYVEGQSLIFYAYDLNAANHRDRQITFNVWGETAGVKYTTYSLGLLRSDDNGGARWVLTFDDPKVLNRINAVYITADRDSKPRREPQGRKLLYAYLGTPNHP
jgi:hypothetical protein